MTFYFSSSRSTDIERQFRDGRRVLPEYLADLMGPIDTEMFTYDEAVELVNKSMLGNLVGTSIESMVSEHMREERRHGSR